MTDTPDECCHRCKFFVALTMTVADRPGVPWNAENDPDLRIGGCHALAPRHFNDGADVEGFTGMARWPRVYGYDWCGDFVEKPGKAI